MARSRKELEPIDREIQRILSRAVESSGKSHSFIAEEAAMSQNRVSKILRKETPPATVGEIMAIAHAVDMSGAEIIREAEESLRPAATVTDLSELRSRVESGEDIGAAALNPDYQATDEHSPETP